DNIFVPDENIQKAKLIDFGLASDTFGTEKSILGDDFAGKFSFSAPEQLGQSGSKVSPKTDAYALGLVLMKAVGLPVPGEGEGMKAGLSRRNDIDVPLDRTGAPLHEVLSQLLKLDPEERPSPITPVFERALAAVENGPPPVRSDKTEAAVKGAAKAQTSSRLPLILAGTALAVVVMAAGLYFVLEDAPDLSGASIDQTTEARQALEADDPLAQVRSMIAEGTEDSLNAALGALLAIGQDDAESDSDRIEALVLAAEMADPETFDAATSPFGEPNSGFARRHYATAAELGSDSARRAVNRLQE
ncbi:MAG: serine/threonine protein kinase, partial [Pseudomonadota bacterium]